MTALDYFVEHGAAELLLPPDERVRDPAPQRRRRRQARLLGRHPDQDELRTSGPMLNIPPPIFTLAYVLIAAALELLGRMAARSRSAARSARCCARRGRIGVVRDRGRAIPPRRHRDQPCLRDEPQARDLAGRTGSPAIRCISGWCIYHVGHRFLGRRLADVSRCRSRYSLRRTGCTFRSRRRRCAASSAPSSTPMSAGSAGGFEVAGHTFLFAGSSG